MIKVGSALLEAAEQLERERGISKEMIFESLKEAMVAAYRKYAKLNDNDGLLCKLLERTGEIGIFERKWVVDALIAPPEPERDEDEGYEDEHGNWILYAEEDAAYELELAKKAALAAGLPWVEPVVEPLVEAPVVEEPVAEVAAEGDGEASEADGEEGYEDAGEAVEEEPEEPAIPALRHQILLKDARKIKADILVGDWLEIEVTPAEFGRIAAQSAKQVIMQRIREAEKLLIQKEFENRKHSVVPGLVQRLEGSNVIVNIGHIDAVLPKREQLPGEYYRVGNKLRVFVLELRDNGRAPQVIVSQAHPQMVREVFELEVPEIEDGLVEIKSIAREAGQRTKVAVHSPDGSVDPQGACIGSRGSRIQAIVNELRNEKIDIIRWAEHPAEFIVNALAPSRIVEVRLDDNPDNQRALVIVPDDQLSLAIGREGQNVRLAAKLTGYKLDIKSISQFEKLRDSVMMRRQEQMLAEGYEPSEGYEEDEEGSNATYFEHGENAEEGVEAYAQQDAPEEEQGYEDQNGNWVSTQVAEAAEEADALHTSEEEHLAAVEPLDETLAEATMEEALPQDDDEAHLTPSSVEA